MSADPPSVDTWFHVAFDFAKANELMDTMDTALKALDDDWEGRFTKLPRNDVPGDGDWLGRHYLQFCDERKLEMNRYYHLTSTLYEQKMRLYNAIEAADMQERLRKSQWDAWDRWWQQHGQERGLARKSPQWPPGFTPPSGPISPTHAASPDR